MALTKPSGPPSWLAPLSDMHDDKRVVAHAGLVEEGHEARQMLVGVVEHAGEGPLQAGEHPPLVGGVLVPRLHAVVARRHACVRRHQAHLLLPRQAPLALVVPAVRETARHSP